MFENRAARVSYDPKSNALYITVSHGFAEKTELVKHAVINIDKDKDGNMLGVEILLGQQEDKMEIKVKRK